MTVTDTKRGADPVVAGLLALAERLAVAAGDELLGRQGRVSGLDTKSSPTDPVSDADRAGERLVADGIAAARPDDGLLGEEGARVAGTSGITWVVDPLDGTVNYLYGRPDWCVSIAAEDSAGALVGVVHQPATGTTWTAVRGAGSHRDGAPLRITAGAEGDPHAGLAGALVATGFSYSAERRAAQAACLARLLPAVRDIRRGGSAALDLCSVADGRSDAYYEHVIQPWDVAAGALVAREAGAVTVGGPDSALPDGILAAAPALAVPLLELVATRPGDPTYRTPTYRTPTYRMPTYRTGDAPTHSAPSTRSRP